jgi:protein-disulfide isomerase
MIHQNAQSAAVAAECVAELGGNDAYWKMADMLFVNQTKLGETLYLQNAKTLKINEAQFKSCLTSGRFDARIAADTQNGMDAGGTGTPYVVILDKDGKATFFSGALPFEQIKTYIDQALGA